MNDFIMYDVIMSDVIMKDVIMSDVIMSVAIMIYIKISDFTMSDGIIGLILYLQSIF